MSEPPQLPAKIVKEGVVVRSPRELVIEIRLRPGTTEALRAGFAEFDAAKRTLGQQPARAMYPFESRKADIDL